MSELVSLIHKHLDWGFSAYINVDQYVHETSARFRSQWGSAYTFALQMALLGLAQQLDNDRRAGETVNVLIEDGHANAVQAIETLHKMKALNDPWLNLGNYGLGGKVHNPILQSADALAFGSCQHLCNRDSLIYSQLISTKRPIYYRVNCDKQLIDFMKGSVESYFAAKREAREEKLLMLRAENRDQKLG